MKQFIVISLLAFGIGAQAVETANCPKDFALSLSNMTAYKSSQNQGIPGWKQARNDLQTSAQDLTLIYVLTKKNAENCVYKSQYGETAAALTIEMHDPEESNPVFSDFLLVNLAFNDSKYTLFLPIESMSKSEGLKIWNRTEQERKEIRASLITADGRKVNAEVGLVRVESL